MILADTSVWVDHFRRKDAIFAAALRSGVICCHDLVLGELACGRLGPRAATLSLLAELPRLSPVDHAEALAFLDAHRLYGRGVGWIDVHLLASATLARAAFWTRDRRLASAARAVGLAAR